jgi:hypothetical protein
MGSLFTTGQVTQSSTGGGVTAGTVLPAGTEITGITSGSVFLDFVAGTVTLPAGSPRPLVRPMQFNLNDLGLTQCHSIGIWVSDADAIINIGSNVTMSDHQLSHVINNYGFSNATITIPANSTPDDTNQIFFMGSTDAWMGYAFPKISHQRGKIDSTSVNAATTVLSKHVGAYNQFIITTYNNDGANSLDMQVQFSEDNSTWFAESGYAGSVTLAAGAFDAYASSIEHHFYRVVINSTVTDSHADFEIFYNFVKDKGNSGL